MCNYALYSRKSETKLLAANGRVLNYVLHAVNTAQMNRFTAFHIVVSVIKSNNFNNCCFGLVGSCMTKFIVAEHALVIQHKLYWFHDRSFYFFISDTRSCCVQVLQPVHLIQMHYGEAIWAQLKGVLSFFLTMVRPGCSAFGIWDPLN